MKIPLSPPALAALVEQVQDVLSLISTSRPVDAKGRYLHWDQMRHRTPPEGLTLRQWWLGTCLSRLSVSRPLPLTSAAGAPFRFSNIDRIQEVVYRIDQQASGRFLSEFPVIGAHFGGRYFVSSLIEEAITSSLLEGAATTRRVAKELLRSGRAPTSRGERMVHNNYHAMLKAEELAGDGGPLTPDAVQELHRIVTDGTLEAEADAGRPQISGERRVNVIWRDGRILHRPPPASELPERMERLCRFANGDLGKGFIHPVVRAIVLHFQIGYDHPFVDGNGRVARALFYWGMLRYGYRLAKYISISSILRQAPAQYARSYLYVETDHDDMTYFIVHQLEVIERAISALERYLARKVLEIENVESLLHGSDLLNHRQIAILSAALRGSRPTFTIKAHAQSHRVTTQSARTDLLGLEQLGLFTKRRAGKRFVFTPVLDLAERLPDLGERRLTRSRRYRVRPPG